MKIKQSILFLILALVYFNLIDEYVIAGGDKAAFSWNGVTPVSLRFLLEDIWEFENVQIVYLITSIVILAIINIGVLLFRKRKRAFLYVSVLCVFLFVVFQHVHFVAGYHRVDHRDNFTVSNISEESNTSREDLPSVSVRDLIYLITGIKIFSELHIFIYLLLAAYLIYKNRVKKREQQLP